MKVLLVDDHPLILSALQSVIKGVGDDVSVLGAGSAAEARAALKQDANYDLVLLDLALGDADGFDVLVELRGAYPALPVVVLSASDRTSDVIRAIDLGAMGFVPKRSSNDMLFEALRMVMSGGLYVPPMMLGLDSNATHEGDTVPDVMRPVAMQASQAGFQKAPSSLDAVGLTPRQNDVLGLLLQGKPNKLIARELNVSVETVKDHVAAVLRALGVSSRTQAVLAVSQMQQQAAQSARQTPDIERMNAAPPAAIAAVAAPSVSAARRFDHVRALFVQTPASLIGYLIGWTLMVAMYWPLAPRAAMLTWSTALALLLLLRLAHYLRFRRQPDADDATLHEWRRSWKLLVLLQASTWGVAVWLFWGLGTPYHLTALMLVVFSLCVASVQLLATQQRLFIAFTCLVLVPAIVRIGTDTTQPWHRQLAGILCLQFLIVLIMGRMQRSALDQVIRLKSHTDKLATQLQVEMGVSDSARRAAEAASLAKTQFFAAASHDLRQPLHAMGLFAEALRQRSHDPEVASLVNSINESVDALEGLFGELLDITRIDTGGVDVNPAAVPMRELFARIRLHFEPIAFEKGLALSFHGERHVAHADPVLLERILRNLVSNAIRYTDDGGVLVSCRPRATKDGDRLLMQVWDSGIGISEGSLPRIFDEFYQVQSQRPLAAHQRKGLGLGLAIVARLASLMQAPITVRSRVGHGTVFRFEVPVGKAVRGLQPTTERLKSPLGLTLQGCSMLVVEDEAAVRDGLVVLLKAWGASVLAFDTVAAVAGWLATAPAEAPDLLIVDYRLPQATTGLDALALLRKHWPGQRLPAIVVTGSTIGGHEAEAAEHDFHLLIKPVLPNKLRAMIAFKLDMR